MSNLQINQQIIFPLGLAVSEAFCNRKEEKSRILHNIERVTHTLLISPRRYGKTSLVMQVLNESDMPFGRTQFFNAYRDSMVVKRFIEGFNELLSKIMTPSQKTLKKMAEVVSHAKVSLQVGEMGVRFSLEPTQQEPSQVIASLLKDIERLLITRRQKAVMFLDEFQDIIDSDMSDELQAILRNFVQSTQHLTFIISGSHRHMLNKLFDDRKKPFYKLFDRISLNRVSEEEYTIFLQELARKQWKVPLSEDVLASIFQLTECHAYYVNNICNRLWRLKNCPQFLDVNRAWHALMNEEFSSVAAELSNLTKNQRLVLQGISHFETLTEPTGTAFLNRVSLSHRSVSLAMDVLEKNDLIEPIREGYRIVDPLMKFVLSQ